jgi:hypothetical protein
VSPQIRGFLFVVWPDGQAVTSRFAIYPMGIIGHFNEAVL